MTQHPFAGPWRIVWMSGWDQDYVDMDVLGHITFGAGRSGSFQFGMDYLVLHRVSDKVVHLLSIRHYQQLSFDFARLWPT